MKNEFDCNKIFAIMAAYYESYGPMDCSYFRRNLFVRVLPNEVNSSEEFTLLEETANEWLTNNYGNWRRTDSNEVDFSGEKGCDDENSIYFASATNADFIEVCYGTLADLTCYPEDAKILEEAARQWSEL